MLPNFLIIGAMKAGTTSLFHYLREHPQVFMAETKELRFFSDSDEQDNWRRGLAWYESQFRNASTATAIGEASPRYSKHPHYPGVPERIAQVLTAPRFIYALRHPIDRMRSQYLHEKLQGAERRPIDEALLEDPVYLDSSRYAYQIDRYLEYFDRDQFLIITAEDLRDRRAQTLARVYEFLGVDAVWHAAIHEQEFYRTAERREPRVRSWLTGRPRIAAVLRRANSTYLRFAPAMLKKTTHQTVEAQAVELSQHVENELKERLRPDVQRLRSYLGDDFGGWGLF